MPGTQLSPSSGSLSVFPDTMINEEVPLWVIGSYEPSLMALADPFVIAVAIAWQWSVGNFTSSISIRSEAMDESNASWMHKKGPAVGL